MTQTGCESVDGTQGVEEGRRGESGVLRGGEVEQLFAGEVPHQGVHVVEVARSGAAPQGEHLVGGEVVEVQDRAEFEGDAGPESAAVGEDLYEALAPRTGRQRFG